MSSNSNTLLDEKVAVSLFLDSLLRETEDFADNDDNIDAEVISDPTVTTTPIISPVEMESKLEIKNEVNVVEQQEKTSLVPEWANESFQILLFEVAGLKLAVPLIELSGVIQWPDSVTEMPGSADFYMGILQHLNHRIAIIDTAKMVLPLKKQAELINDNARERVKHIVLIDNYRWGLACDAIGEVITLEPEEVRWRNATTSRKWLAGTVIDHMCALLNSEAFAAMLTKGQSDEDLAQ